MLEQNPVLDYALGKIRENAVLKMARAENGADFIEAQATFRAVGSFESELSALIAEATRKVKKS